MKTAKDVLKTIKDNDVKYRRSALHRSARQVAALSPSTPALIDEEAFAEGLMFDGSSIAGWKAINESDMSLMPDPTSACMDPFFAASTLVIDLRHSRSGHRPALQPRSARHRQEGRGLSSSRPASATPPFSARRPSSSCSTTSASRPTPTTPASSSTRSNCRPIPTRPTRAAISATASAPRAAISRCRRRTRRRTCAARCWRRWRRWAPKVEKHHHEVASAQHELGLKFGPLTTMADQLQIYKYCIHRSRRATARRRPSCRSRSTATTARACTCHQSIWKGGKPVFAGNKYADLARNASTTSAASSSTPRRSTPSPTRRPTRYKRLVPGFEAPVLLAYSARNRSASCRIPWTSNPKAKRVEVRFPDPIANPYLAFAAMLMAGLDGIKNKIDPGAGDGQGPLRPAAEGAEEDPDGLRLAARGARQASTRTAPSSRPAACSTTTSSTATSS